MKATTLSKHWRPFMLALAAVIVVTLTTPRAYADTTATEQVKANQFVVVFKPSTNPKNAEAAQLIIDNPRIIKLVTGLNTVLEPPHGNVTINFNDTGNMFFDPKTNTINVGYSDLSQDFKSIRKFNPGVSKKLVDKYMVDMTLFMLYHELGHAIVDNFSIPIPSNTETAVDYLAAILALNFNSKGYDIVKSGIITFDIWNRENVYRERKKKTRSHPDGEYWSEHALHKKRFYSIVCMAYGHDPEKVLADVKSSNYQGLEYYLSIDGKRCKALYQRIYGDWLRILIPHFKSIPNGNTMG